MNFYTRIEILTFGAAMLCFICSLFFLSSCVPNNLYEGEPEDGAELFHYRYECLVNGEKVECTRFFEYNRLEARTTGFLYSNPFDFTGYKLYGDSGGNYGSLVFYMALPVDSYPPLYNGFDVYCPFYFYIVGDGDGPFKEGVDYSSSNNYAFYFPENPMDLSEISAVSYPLSHLTDFKGLGVRLLSNSFRFGYSKRDEAIYGNVLDFYFDFKEVITSVPDGYTCTPSVGDTITVSNGHFVESLFFHDLNTIHQLVTPQ